MRLRTQLVAGAGVLLMAGLLLVAWASRARALRAAEAARAAEQRALRAEGLRAAEAATAGRLRREVASLREQLDQVRSAAPGARVREVVRWKTREIEVPCGSPGASPGPAGKDEAPPSPPVPRVHLRIEGLDARLETDAGTRVAVGDLAVYRTWPPPEQLVDVVPWRVQLHLIDEQETRPSARWGIGPAVGIVDGGLAWGAVVESPPAHLWGLEARGVGFALASRDDWTIACGAVIRWGR